MIVQVKGQRLQPVLFVMLFLKCCTLLKLILSERHFLGECDTRSCVMSVLNNYLSDYYALHAAFPLHLSLLGRLLLLLLHHQL